MPNPIWKKPGHFDRFEFTNLSADPQTLTGLHFTFMDELNNVIWTFDAQDMPYPLPIGEHWELSPPSAAGDGDVIKFTGTVNLQSGAQIDFDYVLQNRPPYSYIWQVRLGLQTDAQNNLVAYGNVDFMSPLQASLLPGDWNVH